MALRGGPRRDRGGGARDRELGEAAGGDGDPLPHQRPVASLRGRARAPPDPVRRRRRHEVLRAGRGQGRARVPAPGRAARRTTSPFAASSTCPARGIGAATLDRLAAAARESGRSWWEVSENPAGLTERARTALARFREVVLDLHEKSATWTPSALLEHLLSVTGYAALYEGSEDREDVARRENIEELLSSAREFERRNEEGATIAEYLDTVALATDADSAASGGAVTLSTLHAAKGLEFETVFAVGLEEGYLPHGQSAEDEDELEEERRLLYVGHDPREGLADAHARRPPDGLRPHRGAPPVPLRRGDPEGRGRRAVLRPASADDLRPRAPYEEESQDARPLRRGKRVKHPRYGYGVILTEEGSGEETRLTVYFDRAGKKKFVARYADLTPA